MLPAWFADGTGARDFATRVARTSIRRRRSRLSCATASAGLGGYGGGAATVRPARAGAVASAAHGRIQPLPTRASARAVAIRRWVLIWIGVVLGIAGIGAPGYVVLFGWSLSDAMYMTVITLTTEGYKEVRELDDAGRTGRCSWRLPESASSSVRSGSSPRRSWPRH